MNREQSASGLKLSSNDEMNHRWLYVPFGILAISLIIVAVSKFDLYSGALWPLTTNSRMARNQSEAVASCKTFAEAQEIYRRTDWDKDGVLEYAQCLKELARVGLIESEFAAAEAPAGYSLPWKGYVFQVLTSQGSSATGGARNYISGTNMTLGYALAAVPAEYEGTGRDTFVISNNGTIFQEDLVGGPMPLKFDPKISWNYPE